MKNQSDVFDTKQKLVSYNLYKITNQFMNKIAIIDAQSASVRIETLPENLQNAQDEEIREHYNIGSESDYIFGDISISIEL